MNVGIVGASGYSGEVLVKLLLGHPQVKLVAVTSRQHAGKTVATVIPALRGTAAEQLKFNPELRVTLKKAGHLTRDPREKERKKAGQPGARKRFQFSKR